MPKKLVVLRNERATYEVHLEFGDPTQKRVGGQSLDLERLRVELLQHGCSQERIAETMKDVENCGTSTFSI